MADTNDVASRVKQLVVENLGINEPAKVVDGANFVDDLGADSLDTVQLVMALEDEFSIEIPDAAAEEIKTVKNAIDYVQQNMAA